MIGILYFSSTGNSLYIAQKIQKRLGGQIKYIPSYEGNGGEFEKILVVTPFILTDSLLSYMTCCRALTDGKKSLSYKTTAE